MPRYGQVDDSYAMTLASSPAGDGEAIYMLNLMAYRDEADYGPDGERGVSGREADDRYAPLDVLADLGASVCLFADVIDASEPWDRVAVVRYPTRRSFIEMQSRKDFQAQHVHKEAGMSRTIIMGTLPAGGLPVAASDALLLEVFSGEDASVVDDPVIDDAATDFTVEGTIVGDGRRWSRVRYTSVDEESGLPSYGDGGQGLLLRPRLQQWS